MALLTVERLERTAARAHALGTAAVAAAVPLAAGVFLATSVAPTLHSKEFPWITSRALGIAAYLSLFALVLVGMWMRHPWRRAVRSGHAESHLRAHAAIGAATLSLVVAHVVFLATDRYAGVGWTGALVPGLSHYRHIGVGLGVVALYMLVAIALTARFAGATGARHWHAVHRLALPTYLVAWFHGVLSGADVAVLRPVYVVTGAMVTTLAATRLLSWSAPRRAVSGTSVEVRPRPQATALQDTDPNGAAAGATA